MRKFNFLVVFIVILGFLAGEDVHAQQYKLKQANSMMGMKFESTIYVKGMRKRTEGGAANTMMGGNLTTIQQCDLHRTIKINDKKQLYLIEPFNKETEEVIDEDAKPATVKKPVPVPNSDKKTGGTITTWYTITDTGERKNMYGFTARHVWTFQKMKPSPDACNMKDSMIIKTDGWYIDLPQFNCPVQYSRSKPPGRVEYKPDCQDKYISRRKGKGKLGFPLTETTTIIMGNAEAQTTNFETSIETLELTTAKLDSMLFEIPPGYKETKSEEELQDKFDVSEFMKQAGVDKEKLQSQIESANKDKPGMIRIGVFQPTGDEQVQNAELQQHLANSLTVGNVQGIPIASEEEGKKMNCTYLLTTDFVKFKQASKVGGLLKAIKNTDPSAATSFNIEATLTLKAVAGTSPPGPQKVNGKYEGRMDVAAKRALDDGSKEVLSVVK